MPSKSDQSRRVEAVMNNPHDMQIDEETGQPVSIAPDGEKDTPARDQSETEKQLKIDPNSRIPRPVQPDLA